jgi:hypothetical protein
MADVPGDSEAAVVQDIEYLEPSPADDAGQPVAPRRTGGRLRWAVAFGALVTFVVGAVAVVVHEPAVDGRAALAAAQRTLERSSPYRYEVRTTLHTTSGDPDGAGSDSTERTLTKGEVVSDHEWRLVEDLGEDMGFAGSQVEVRRIDDELYIAAARLPDAVGPAWQVASAPPPPTRQQVADALADSYDEDELDADDPEYDPASALQLLLGAYLLPLESDPQGIERLVAESTDPQVEEQLDGGGLRLRTTLAPIPEIVEVADRPVPPVEVVLDLDRERRPTGAHLSVAVEGASSTVDASFRDWGSDLAVAPPPSDDIDRTPWIAEEALAAADPSLLLAPTVLPPGFELVAADVYDDWDEAGETESCTSIDLTYDTKADADQMAALEEDDPRYDEIVDAQPYLDVTISPPDCGYAEEGFDEPFAGFPSDGVDDGIIDLLVRGVVVSIDFDNVDEADIEALVRSLAPTTAPALVAAIPAWAQGDSDGLGSRGAPSGRIYVDL